MLPPGPRTPAFWQTYRFITKPLEYSRDTITEYGEVIRVHALNGRGVVVGNPEIAKLVFAADPDTFETPEVMGELLGAQSVIATSGPKHKKQRKLMNPRFHGAQVRSFLEAMQRVTRANLEAFAKAQASGEVVVMTKLSERLTVDVILEVVFGHSKDLDRERARGILRETLDALSPALVASPLLRSRWFPPWRRFLRARAAFDAFVDEILAERRANGSGADILGLLLDARYEDGSAMEGSEIRDHLVTLLNAGHETTAVTIAWAVYFLLKYPRVLERLRADLAALGEDAPLESVVKLPYLDAVCSESLRIEPAVTDVARLCKKPFVLGEWTVPAGEIVFVNMCWLLRHPKTFDEPFEFRPERFLERKYGPHEFMPFGGGTRRCLGAAFAESELAIVLATIAREWDLELADGEPETAVRRNITMGPKNGVRVKVVARRALRDATATQNDRRVKISA
jgi:cytochrome P450 family 110